MKKNIESMPIFALIIAGGTIVSFAGDLNLKVLGDLLIIIGSVIANLS